MEENFQLTCFRTLSFNPSAKLHVLLSATDSRSTGRHRATFQRHLCYSMIGEFKVTADNIEHLMEQKNLVDTV